jgi:hypothetical protein
MVQRDSSPQITHFQLSTVQWHHSLHHFRQHLVFTGEIFGLWAAARPWNPIPLNSRHSHGAAWTIRSTAELTGDCFTQYLASFMNQLLQRSMVPVGH